MTGKQFERLFCVLLQKSGYWALNISKDERGAQPFDVIAMKDGMVVVTDCKVCTSLSFPMSRVEENQWMSFDMVSKKTLAKVGLSVYHDGDVLWISYGNLLKAKNSGKKSVNLSFAPILFGRSITKEIAKELNIRG